MGQNEVDPGGGSIGCDDGNVSPMAVSNEDEDDLETGQGSTANVNALPTENGNIQGEAMGFRCTCNLTSRLCGLLPCG